MIKINKNAMLKIVTLTVFVFIAIVGPVLITNRITSRKKKNNVVTVAPVSTAILSDGDIKNIIQTYSQTVQSYNQDLLKVNSAAWNKVTLDKAYFNLVYAGKIESFNDVYSMLSIIENAQKSGINIDENSFGIDQKKRDEIKLRADKLANAIKQGAAQ